MPGRERIAAILLLAASTLVFVWLISPLRSAMVWAVAGAILFLPMHRRLEDLLAPRRNLAALLTTAVMMLVLVIPTALVLAAVMREVGALANLRGAALWQGWTPAQLHAAVPTWAHWILAAFGSDDPVALQRRLEALASAGADAALGWLIGVGQGAFGAAVQLGVMVYLTFFLVRDGPMLATTFVAHLPLPEGRGERLVRELGTVLRATLRGTVIVAIVQGALGGLIFWGLGLRAPVLWAVAMAFLALLPPLGASLVWAPAAGLLLLAGDWVRGLALIGAGLFLIGLIDNFLRPILVGRGASLPEYVVLLSTLGGLALLGLDGIVLGPMVSALCLASWREARLATADPPIASP